MAGIRQRTNGAWEFKFQKKGVLPSPVYFTFSTLEEGKAYEAVAEELLARGVVPAEMGEASLDTLQHLFDAYELSGMATKSDREMFPLVGKLVGGTDLKLVNYDWTEKWARKLAVSFSPSSIKKRMEFLGRALAWGIRTDRLSLQNNPVKQLPKGYATKDVPKERLWAGERDRRLEPTEEGAIRKTLVKKEEGLLFDMALETAMRLREMFTLTVGQIDIERRTIFLDRTKNGSKRQVPISSVLVKILPEFLEGKEAEALVFPFWNGKEPASAATNRLSHLFATRFEKAGCPDLRFHDLRHEATSRIYERTTLTDLEVASITGHSDLRMLQRYANLRASTLVNRLW